MYPIFNPLGPWVQTNTGVKVCGTFSTAVFKKKVVFVGFLPNTKCCVLPGTYVTNWCWYRSAGCIDTWYSECLTKFWLWLFALCQKVMMCGIWYTNHVRKAPNFEIPFRATHLPGLQIPRDGTLLAFLFCLSVRTLRRDFLGNSLEHVALQFLSSKTDNINVGDVEQILPCYERNFRGIEFVFN